MTLTQNNIRVVSVSWNVRLILFPKVECEGDRLRRNVRRVKMRNSKT